MELRTAGLGRLLSVGKAAGSALKTERFEWQTLQIFVVICLHGGEVPMQEIQRVTGLAQSAVSRNVAKLGSGLTAEEVGAGLIEAFEDPAWRRRKIVRLTALGRKVAEQLDGLMT